jgi:hypothetical protein
VVGIEVGRAPTKSVKSVKNFDCAPTTPPRFGSRDHVSRLTAALGRSSRRSAARSASETAQILGKGSYGPPS